MAHPFPVRFLPARYLLARYLLALAATGLALAGCSGDDLTRTFGLSRDAPNEFVVTTQAPLSMPPDFALRPPEPGAPRPGAQSDSRQAEAVLVPQIELNQSPASLSAGQQALVADAGPAAPAGLRSQVDTEAARDRPDQGLINRLMFWKAAPLPGTLVDPSKEQKRLQENAALGQSPEAGQTPIIQRQATSLFGNIF
jgi:hypothetical protein